MTCSDLFKFTNCQIVRNHEIVKDDLWVKSGYIVNPEIVFYNEKFESPVTEIDMNGCLLAPGFIDIQINGGFGIDFSNNFLHSYKNALDLVANGLLRFGVTGFCPTLVSSDQDVYKEVLPRIKMRKGGKDGAAILGVHLEGPFINTEKRGAHYVEHIIDFDDGVDSISKIYGNLNNVKIVTLAPEKEQAMDVIKYLVGKNIKVSLGHSKATFNQGLEAFRNGSTLLTHLYNAMNPFLHRDPGLIGLITEDSCQQVYYSIIADGTHVHSSALKMAYRSNPKGLILVTDAISAMNNLTGVNTIGDLIIEIKNSRPYIAGSDTLAGSTLTMDECVRTFKKMTQCPLVDALESASLHPAQFLEIDKSKGSFQFGADADFVCLDSDLKVISTWIAGECVYKLGD